MHESGSFGKFYQGNATGSQGQNSTAKKQPGVGKRLIKLKKTDLDQSSAKKQGLTLSEAKNLDMNK